MSYADRDRQSGFGFPAVFGGRSGDGIGRSLTGWALGDRRHIGLWIFPLFVLVALLGATMAGGVAVLYYSQQVSQLEAATSGSRAAVEAAREEVSGAAEQARADIEALVADAREAVASDLPFAVPAERGIYGASANLLRGETRVGTVFAVFSDDSQTFLATTSRLVSPDGVTAVSSVDVFLPDGPVAAQVVNIDPAYDVAVLSLPRGGMPTLEWRPIDQAIARGDQLFLVGIAGRDTPAIAEGTVAAVSPQTVVPTMPVNDFVAGGPLLDSSARVVAIASVAYQPFGPVLGGLSYGVPVRALCLSVMQCSDADLGGRSAGVLSGPVEPAGAGQAQAPRPEPTALPSPSPSPVPTIPTPAPTAPPTSTFEPLPSPSASPAPLPFPPSAPFPPPPAPSAPPPAG